MLEIGPHQTLEFDNSLSRFTYEPHNMFFAFLTVHYSPFLLFYIICPPFLAECAKSGVRLSLTKISSSVGGSSLVPFWLWFHLQAKAVANTYGSYILQNHCLFDSLPLAPSNMFGTTWVYKNGNRVMNCYSESNFCTFRFSGRIIVIP